MKCNYGIVFRYASDITRNGSIRLKWRTTDSFSFISLLPLISFEKIKEICNGRNETVNEFFFFFFQKWNICLEFCQPMFKQIYSYNRFFSSLLVMENLLLLIFIFIFVTILEKGAFTFPYEVMCAFIKYRAWFSFIFRHNGNVMFDINRYLQVPLMLLIRINVSLFFSFPSHFFEQYGYVWSE